MKKKKIVERLEVDEQKLNICSGVNIWFSFGLCKLALAVTLFTVTPIPSQGDFPWEVAKKFQVPSSPKSFSCWTDYRNSSYFYIGQHPPSLKYSSFQI